MRYALLLVLLAGCSTPGDRAERVAQHFGPYCDKLGYARDSDAWRTCVREQDARPQSAAQRLINGTY